ncbi:MAG: hypothetical protein RKU31_05460 [Deltaproteobacteria bacterium]|jgi:hypothetical protein
MTPELITLLVVGASGPVTFDWRAPEVCPERQVVVDRIELLLGRSLDETFDRALEVTATATAAGGRYTVRIDTVDDDGRHHERTVQSEEGETSCASIVDVTALVVAMAIDPAAISWAQPTEEEPVEETETSTAPPKPARAPGRPPLDQDGLRAPGIVFGIPLPRLDFRAGARVGTQVLPGTGFGLSFGGAVLWDPLRFYGAATVWLDRTTPVPEATVGLWTMDGSSCYVATPTKWLEVPICIGLQLGRFAADSVSQEVAPVRSFWGGSTLSTGLSFVVTNNLAFMLDLEGVVSWVRPRYEIEGVNVRMGRFGARSGLWIELRFP